MTLLTDRTQSGTGIYSPGALELMIFRKDK